MSNRKRASILGVVIGNGGFMFGALEYGMTDIILLRCFAIMGCGSIILYQMLQPRLQYVSAGWNGIYVLTNIIQLKIAAASPPPELSWEEARLHELFEKNISATHFFEILALGEWLWLVDGAVLAEEGASPEEAQLTFVTEGTCSVSLNGEKVAEMGPGSTIGELGMLVDGPVSATVAAAGPVRCFSVPIRSLRERLEAEPTLRAPLEKLFSGTLATKALAMDDTLPLQNYRAMLEVACTLDEFEGISEGVQEYRVQHGVSAELHAQLMEELPQCVHKPFRISSSQTAEQRHLAHTDASQSDAVVTLSKE